MSVKPIRPIFSMLLLAAAAPARALPAMSYLRTYGPAGDPVTQLDWGLLAISVLVCIIIALLILLAIFRRRPTLPPPSRPGEMPVVHMGDGMRWIYIGVGISTVVLIGSAVWTILTLSAVAAPPKNAMTIEVIGHQWWWEVKYPGDTPSQLLETANEIHIPTGRPVRLRLTSADVIHSFWVPQLAGKTDMIPGQVNYAWVQADRPGIFRGQCGEYCGAQHAHMIFQVVAQAPDQFDAWRREQMQAAVEPAQQQAVRGSQVFTAHCAVCHTVRGAGAHGRAGPDLTHLMSRHMIASGTLPNNTGNLNGWVANAPQIKPGTLMPRLDLSPEDLHAVVAYLETLK